MAHFDFDDGLSNKLLKSRRKSKKSNPHHIPTSTGAGIGTAYQLGSTTSTDYTEDGSGSLTYSASSSQTGESTDSSIIDVGIMLQLERENQIHLLQKREAMRYRNERGQSLSRGNSAIDSLGYSDDDVDEHDESMNISSWNNFHTISGQPSDSHGNDHGGFKKVEPSPKGVTHKRTPMFSPTSAIAPDLQSCSGSNSTPNTPPPRHSARKMMSHDEVWYQKWWMCGFTDALNLNPKC